MKLTISSSMKHILEAQALAARLEEKGVEAGVPTTEKLGTKRAFIDNHLEKLQQSDALLIANFKADGNEYGQVGVSCFFEAGWAYALDKKVYVLNPVDPEHPFHEDLMAITDKILNDDIDSLEGEK
jgi:nucleoside 2-deoxyribosyltransferase